MKGIKHIHKFVLMMNQLIGKNIIVIIIKAETNSMNIRYLFVKKCPYSLRNIRYSSNIR